MTKTILIVDDEADIRQTLKDIAEAKGCVVHEADNGEHALKKAKSVSVDLILLDVMMPGLKTKDILEQLRANEKTKKTPVVLVTVMRFGEEELKELLSSTNVVNYVAKPFDVQKIMSILPD